MRSASRLIRALVRARRSGHPRGVSILEVLFAILITAIGLMGAIAVFPAAMLNYNGRDTEQMPYIRLTFALTPLKLMQLCRVSQRLHKSIGQHWCCVVCPVLSHCFAENLPLAATAHFA